MIRNTYTVLAFSICTLIAVLLIAPVPALAQTGNATLSGVVEDKSGAALPGVAITVTNVDTGVPLRVMTNKVGAFSVPALNPGKYSLLAVQSGFSNNEVKDIVLNVGDTRELVIHLSVGGKSETVTVDASSVTINTTDATVGTVIDRQFVENIPLNGRSFQDLIMLSPGVTTSTSQGNDSSGEFSVNGQRTYGNSYTLDGVSATNAGTAGSSGPGTSGSISNATALGTTQAIISVDALQEFRIATATYSAEFGRQPGAQISFTSRSGTNQYHGTLFNYVRNYAFDANNWFNNYSTPALARTEERQNDFGGVIGGPISIPKVFSGRDRAFWFFSYEGLRLGTPVPAKILYAPSNGTFNTATYTNAAYRNLRANAPAVLRPVLNAMPLPNCSSAINPQCIDHGDGLSPVLFSTTTPASINAILGRVDFQAKPWLHIFGRYSDTDSSGSGSYYFTFLTSIIRNRTYLLGADSVISSSIANQLRLQYSPAYQAADSSGTSINGETSITGQTGTNFPTLEGVGPGGTHKFVFENFAGGEGSSGIEYISSGGRQFMVQAVDAVTWVHGRHNFKAGADFRQITAYLGDGNLSSGPGPNYIYYNAAQILANKAQTALTTNIARQDPIAKSLGIYFQDEWHVQPRLSLSLGLRWEFNPPTSISGVQQYTYTGSISNPSTLALSKLGAPLYKKTYTNFAPRVGGAYVVHNERGHELVLRAGAGLFFDTGQSSINGGIGDGFGLGASYSYRAATGAGPFPLPASYISSQYTPGPGTAPYSLRYVPDPNFTPPSTVQWSVSLEQSFGLAQTVTIGYVGTAGRKLARLVNHSNPSSLFAQIDQFENGPGSNYNSLQLQYKRAMAHGLQVISSYTWAHAIDSDSQDYSSAAAGSILNPQRGNSDHDLRNNFSVALVYNTPVGYANRLARTALGSWGINLNYILRSAFPVQPVGPTVTDITGVAWPTRLNYNGKYPYVRKAGIPGGRQFDPTVFSIPVSASAVGNAPRNFIRGFGENVTQFALQRTFPIYEQVHLQFRAEAFNLFNHPNFGRLNLTCGPTAFGATCNNVLMGQATGTLSATSLNSLYTSGGPRALQFALKLQY